MCFGKPWARCLASGSWAHHPASFDGYCHLFPGGPSGVSTFCDAVSQPGSCCGDRSIPLCGKSHAGSFLPRLSSQGCVTWCPSKTSRAPLGAGTEPDNVRWRMIMRTGPCPHEAHSLKQKHGCKTMTIVHYHRSYTQGKRTAWEKFLIQPVKFEAELRKVPGEG